MRKEFERSTGALDRDNRVIETALTNVNQSEMVTPPPPTLPAPLTHCSLQMSPKGTTYWVPNCSNDLKPCIGMIFATLEEGVNFYKQYACVCGFGVRFGTEVKANDGTITLKYVVCNREGFKRKIEKKNIEIEPTSGKAKHRTRTSTRVGCKAKIVFRFSGNKGYTVIRFEESHTHDLSSPKSLQFLKANRNLNKSNQKFNFYCSKVDIGPNRSYRVYKESVGGYENVGASMADFKNFSRDLKAHIEGSDAQIVVKRFLDKQDIFPAFYFDYDVDESGTLTKLFWADAISRRNYNVFGDVVSFDVTYGTNKYNMVFALFTGVDNHKRCITFGVGFICKEDEKSYKWLFETFLKAMDHEPGCLITDQDPAMKEAIDNVFKKTEHRLCMWLIMSKMPEKIVKTIYKDTTFIKEINEIVWSNSLEPYEFEEKWMTITRAHGLENHDWLSHIFDIRHFWIPSYFQNTMAGFIRTTSRSESENFFCKFTNPFKTLVEFLLSFETAMDAQRHAISMLNNISNTSQLPLETPLEIESHASEVYTHTIFKEVQKEIKIACFSCIIHDMRNENGVWKYEISVPNGKHYEVVHNPSSFDTTCTCKKFQRFGIACCHMFWVFKNTLKTIPSQYVLNRWTKDALKNHSPNLDFGIVDESAKAEKKQLMLHEIWSEMHSCISIAEKRDGGMKDLLDHMRCVKNKLMPNKDEGKPSKTQDIELLSGSSQPTKINVLPPRVTRNKGSEKRLNEGKEKAMEQQRNKRLCRSCNELAYHDSRTCPSKKQ